MNSGGSTGSAIPTPDSTNNLALSASAGKFALVNNTTALSGTNPVSASIVDLVGYGTTANGYEGSGPVTPNLSSTTSAQRNSQGCTDTDNNNTDFTTGAPNPRNSLSATHSCATITPPVISSITPSSLITNAGFTATFTVSLSFGDVPLTYYWYRETASSTNLIATVTTNAMTCPLNLPNVSALDSASYQVVVSNASTLTVTSDVVALTVVDPAIVNQPASQVGILNGQVSFSAMASGTGIGYQWYYCADPADNQQITSAVANGTLASGAIASGANTSTLNLTNLQSTDPTNFVLVVTGTYGSVTSSVVSLSLSTTAVPLAFWTFNGPLDATNPATYQGIGLASPTNVSPFLSSANYSASDSYPGTPNNGWGTKSYPNQGTFNKLAGAQFAASTVGAKNVKLSFDLRATAGASKYFRLQYTTNGTVYADCPASSTIGTSANNWWSYNYDLTGYPGAQNNPNFGVRVVAEFESTAKYGNTNNANYVAVSGSYNNDPTFGGTYTFDVVKITGDAITDANQPPTIGTVTNISFTDTVGGTLNFTVNDDGGAGALNVSAASLDPSVSLTLNAVNTGGNVALSINSSLNNGLNVNVPVLITVADGNGNSTVAWFTATVVPNNTVPTLTGLSNTNMLTNSVLVIPFKVVDNAPAGVTVTADAAYNPVLLPNGSVVVSGTGTNRTLTITPAAGQSGTAAIKLTADDTTYSSVTTIFLTVRPRNSVLLVDNFDWANGPLITNSAFFWQHHGGNTFGELQVADGRIIVDNIANFEDVNAPLIGAPIMTNTPTVLYAKLEINCSVAPSTSAGSYFAHFKDDANGFFCRLFISSNTPSSYWVGIGNSSGSSSTTARLPQALNVGETYTVVCRMVVSNTVCTVWVNPASEADTSATANDAVSNRNNVYAYAFRENSPAGIINVSNVVVATSFSAATGLPPTLSIRPDSGKAILSWTDSDYGLQAAPAVTGTYTNVPGATSPFTNAVDEAAKFYRLTK